MVVRLVSQEVLAMVAVVVVVVAPAAATEVPAMGQMPEKGGKASKMAALEA